jgi:hypothetical protein
LIVAAVLVQPRNWKKVGAAVGGHRLLVMQLIIRRTNCEWD